MFRNLLHIIRKRNKLHTLDYIMIMLVIGVVGIFLSLRLARKTEWVTVSIRIQPDNVWWRANPEPWYASSFVLDEVAYDSFGQKTAQIVDIHTIEAPDGKVDTIIDVSLKASVNSQKKQYTFNYQPILVGRPIELLFQKTALGGAVVNIGSSFSYVDKIIEIRLLAEFPWKIDFLKKGLQAIDYYGRVTAQILEIESQNAQSYEFFDTSGRRFFFPTQDSNRKDAIIKLKVKALEYNGLYYSMTGAPLKAGSDFQIQFPEVALNWAVISKIYEE